MASELAVKLIIEAATGPKRIGFLGVDFFDLYRIW